MIRCVANARVVNHKVVNHKSVKDKSIVGSRSKHSPSIVAIVSTGAVLFSSSLMVAWASLSSSAIAASSIINKQYSESVSQGSATPDRLPRHIARQLRRDLARRLNISHRELSVVRYSHQTWSDSCLGLGGIAELCAQALVPGWQVELTNGEQTWTYHTDETGQTVRLQEQPTQRENGDLPSAVADRILERASDDSGVSESELTLAEVHQRTWDGCLGIMEPDSVCTKIALLGWQVVVAAEGKSWVYHSDAEGSEVRLNETASLPNSDIIPDFIPSEQLPTYAGNGVVFQAIEEGGITGSSNQILLLEDGQIVQFADDQGVSTATELTQVSSEQVQAFIELLQQQSFSNLHSLNYPAPAGAADYRTITFTSQGSTTRYADINQDQLPSALQQVIQAWNQMVSE